MRGRSRDWNSTSAAQDYKGFVTEFELENLYAAQFEAQTVGGRQHRELWVPAEELPRFNAHIEGLIEVVARFERGRPSHVGAAERSGDAEACTI